MSYYLKDGILSEYLLFHYGDNVNQYPWPFDVNFAKDFHLQIVEQVKSFQLPERGRALDLGCAVGRIAFELTNDFDEVLGIDYTDSFIEAANHLKNSGSISFSYPEEGALCSESTFTLQGDINVNKVSFEVGDAMNLRSNIGKFDVVVMANLIDRLPDPKKMLEQAHKLLNQGGILFILSPYTWLEEFTPKDKWVTSEGNWPTFAGLKEVLDEKFSLEKEVDLPFMIRETRRKFQCSVSNGTVWKLV